MVYGTCLSIHPDTLYQLLDHLRESGSPPQRGRGCQSGPARLVVQGPRKARQRRRHPARLSLEDAFSPQGQQAARLAAPRARPRRGHRRRADLRRPPGISERIRALLRRAEPQRLGAGQHSAARRSQMDSRNGTKAPGRRRATRTACDAASRRTSNQTPARPAPEAGNTKTVGRAPYVEPARPARNGLHAGTGIP